MSNLKFLGFCGADDNTTDADLAKMLALSRKFPRVEWGILFHPDKAGTPRYPTRSFVDRLCKHFNQFENANLAAHLYGHYVEQALAGDTTFVNQLFLDGFNRIKINATVEDGVDITTIPTGGLHAVIEATPYLDWIIPSNQQTISLVQEYVGRYPNVFVLHDASCGTGRPITHFPSVRAEQLSQLQSLPIMEGYAGGIGIYNVSNIVTRLEKLSDQLNQYWIDMESGVRSTVLNKTGVSIFDVEKCAQIVNICLEIR